jgi:ABC-type nitrate/sulfonate/bicarbonate transport system permease component
MSQTPSDPLTPGSDPQEPIPRTAPRGFTALRSEIPLMQALWLGAACLLLCLLAWWFLTRGQRAEDRILSSSILPSPQETFASFPSLWFERALTRNLGASLRRVVLGFGLAALVGVPLGVLCGCFRRAGAFFAPLTIIGRNIPIAALIPLSFSLFGIGEFQKVMFLFIACVAFVISDTARAIGDINSRYIDTAYTLGANRWQIIVKVLVPLAMPNVFNSLRLLFGLAFGYIMLAELVKVGGESGGLGDIINTSLRRGIQTHILLVLMIIPLVALVIDRALVWVQRQLFPYQYGSSGILHAVVVEVLRVWEDLKSLVFRPRPAPSEAPVGQGLAPESTDYQHLDRTSRE